MKKLKEQTKINFLYQYLTLNLLFTLWNWNQKQQVKKSIYIKRLFSIVHWWSQLLIPQNFYV